MKKMLSGILIIVMIVMIIPLNVFADDATYTSMNLDEALTEEGIEHDFSNYEETDDQITIYLFRGNGCSYCDAFLTFLNSIIDDYGKYFKVVSYEVWYDEDNASLMSEVADYLGDSAEGVPYIVIGDQTFEGYSDSYDDEIKSAIEELYNSEDRYDVFEEMENNPKEETEESGSTSFSTIVFNLIVTALAAVAVVLYDRSKRNELIQRIEVLENKQNKKKSKES